MKNFILTPLLLFLFACAENQQLSHTETSKIVVESFYTKDNDKLENYTTSEGYGGLTSIQNLISGKKKALNFKVLNETVDGDTAWVKFTTAYDDKAETFKLVKEDGIWKVTRKGLREKRPF